MSSGDDDSQEHEDNAPRITSGSKKRRVQRACDVCRRKKIRCDGGQVPGKCSTCIAFNFDCTFVEAAKKRGPPKGYVENLENRLEKMEELLKKLDRNSEDTQYEEADHSSSSLLPNPLNRTVAAEDPDDSDDELVQLKISESMRRLSMNPSSFRFFGKSSGIMLIKNAINLKTEYSGEKGNKRPDLLHSRRKEFWETRPWELSPHEEGEPIYSFPEDDLLYDLIDLYFSRINSLLPLLHRPTFENSVSEGLHITNEAFAYVVLLVCAIGSRFSNDPRVFLPNSPPGSCGWRWFEQVKMLQNTMLMPSHLHDIQKFCLYVLYLQGCSAPQASWALAGIGIRFAQDVGAHRRKSYSSTPTVEDEQWKRAFWILIILDRIMSSSLGRPCAVQDEDFDIDMPIECDDEYWVNPDPEKAFQQPAGKPSIVTYFNRLIKLHQIHAFALRTIYSINKSKVILGFVGHRWEQHIVSELDSALNKWVDTIPEHLRWDPNREDLTFFNQSAALYVYYYHVQILVHRPFIPSSGHPSLLALPSLSICTNAARSCSHLVDIQRRKTGSAIPHLQMAVFTSAIVLLLNIWGGRQSGVITDPAKEMVDVHKCMQTLRSLEDRWHNAGRFWDVLNALASVGVGDLPLPHTNHRGHKRRRYSSDGPDSSSPPPSVPSLLEGRIFAGSRRVSKEMHNKKYWRASEPKGYTDDGRPPLHEGIYDTAPQAGPSSWYPPSNVEGSDSDYSLVQPTTSPNYDHIFFSQYANAFSTERTSSSSSHPNPSLVENTRAQRQPTYGTDDTIAMWENAPTGFELDDWGTYVGNFGAQDQDPR